MAGVDAATSEVVERSACREQPTIATPATIALRNQTAFWRRSDVLMNLSLLHCIMHPSAEPMPAGLLVKRYPDIPSGAITSIRSGILSCDVL